MPRGTKWVPYATLPTSGNTPWQSPLSRHRPLPPCRRPPPRPPRPRRRPARPSAASTLASSASAWPPPWAGSSSALTRPSSMAPSMPSLTSSLSAMRSRAFPSPRRSLAARSAPGSPGRFPTGWGGCRSCSSPLSCSWAPRSDRDWPSASSTSSCGVWWAA